MLTITKGFVRLDTATITLLTQRNRMHTANMKDMTVICFLVIGSWGSLNGR